MNGHYTPILLPHAKRQLDRFTGKTLQRLREAIANCHKIQEGEALKS